MGRTFQQAFVFERLSREMIATTLPPAQFATLESIKVPLPDVDVRIVDADDGIRELGVDEVGEMILRAPQGMAEYWNNPLETAEILRTHGPGVPWLHTGDLGYVDADGRLFVTGRKKEIIVLSSGKNLYPEEIEAHYRQSPLIKELCILGLTKPGEPSAERLHAVIVPDEQVLQDRGITNVRELVRFDIEGLSIVVFEMLNVFRYGGL